jgi:hypothetical protein
MQSRRNASQTHATRLFAIAALATIVASCAPARPSYGASFWEQARHVCSEGPIPGAAPYLEPGMSNKVVALEPWSDSIPADWLPTSIAETELVLCIGPEVRVLIQVCDYIGGPPINRYRYEREVTLREAQTAEVVAGRTFRGSDPRACGEREEVALMEIEGRHAEYTSDVTDWLARYVDIRLAPTLPPVRSATPQPGNCGIVASIGQNASGDAVVAVTMDTTGNDVLLVRAGPLEFEVGDHIAVNRAGGQYLYAGMCP